MPVASVVPAINHRACGCPVAPGKHPGRYPGPGRVIEPGVSKMRSPSAWLSNGKIPPAGLHPHDDLLAEFPYLGLPNP
jgi:hypothetical protein